MQFPSILQITPPPSRQWNTPLFLLSAMEIGARPPIFCTRDVFPIENPSRKMQPSLINKTNQPA